MIWNILTNIIGGGIRHYSNYKTLSRRKELELLEKETDLNKVRITQQDNSWKDEFVLIVLCIPLIFVGLGLYDPIYFTRLKEYFALLNELPTWYQYLLIGVFGAIYGLKPMMKK